MFQCSSLPLVNGLSTLFVHSCDLELPVVVVVVVVDGDGYLILPRPPVPYQIH